MFAKQFSLAVAALLLSAGASAQVGVTADLGTTGVGAHVVIPMETYLNGRFGVNYIKHDFDKTTDKVHYDVAGKLLTVDFLFDWYLRQGSDFRLTGGVVYNGNRLSADGRPNASGQFTLNGHTYTTKDVGALIGTVDYRKAAPYFGIGWGNALAKASNGRGWNVNADLGVYYMGNPNVKLANLGCGAATAVCTTIAKDVAVERVKLQDDADKLKVWPVLRVGVGYAF